PDQDVACACAGGDVLDAVARSQTALQACFEGLGAIQPRHCIACSALYGRVESTNHCASASPQGCSLEPSLFGCLLRPPAGWWPPLGGRLFSRGLGGRCRLDRCPWCTRRGVGCLLRPPAGWWPPLGGRLFSRGLGGRCRLDRCPWRARR